MADDVADRDPEAPAADREQVVPVTAEARALRCRQVPGRGLDPRERGELLGEERPLEGLGDAPLLVELGVVDRERGAVGGELEQVAVGRGEVARREGADVEDADDAALDEERHAEEAADPLLAEQRVEDVAMVDVGDDDRTPLGRDAPREAAADGDPDALLDLLLDALGGSRAQHAAVLLEHEDGGGVGVEDLAHAVEQRAEQVLRGQVGERGVGDALDGLDDAHGVLRLLARTPLAFEEPGVVDRERGAVGRDLQEVAILGREVAGRERADVQDADTRPPTRSGTPRRLRIPFSRRIGLRMSAWSTSGMTIGRRSAATRPAKPRPTGMRTRCSTSSSIPFAARARSIWSSSSSTRRNAAVSLCRTSATRSSSSARRSSSVRWASAASVTRCSAASGTRASRPSR